MVSALLNNVADLVWQGPGGPFAVVELRVDDAISELATTKLIVQSENPSISFSSMINAEAKLAVKCGTTMDQERYFSGIITRFSQSRTTFGQVTTTTDKTYFYEIELRPKLWLLTKVFRSRVYQKMTVRDIATEVMGEFGVNNDWKISGTYDPREYCVQYQETCFEFLSRLFEDEGISYTYDHEKKKILLMDKGSQFTDCKPLAKASYWENPTPMLSQGENEHINDLIYEEVLGSGTYEVKDYNYRSPHINLMEKDQKGAKPQFGNLEVYEHTINYGNREQGQKFSKQYLEEETASLKFITGSGFCRSFTAGTTFTLDNHYRGDLNRAWLLTHVQVEAIQGRYFTKFRAIPSDAPIRPRRVTPKPTVKGVQTAVITGPPDAEVYLDNLGRAKLQFHWDREGKNNDRSSMWVRVSNGYAGKDYGIQWIPRIGHEVLVEFIEGDPDRPVVTGRVYHEANSAPLGPGEKWRNIIKTIKDHHIIFDDQDDKELIDIRSHKDMGVLVVNDEKWEIGNDRTHRVGRNEQTRVGKNRKDFVDSNETREVGGNRERSVGGKETVEVGKSSSLKVGKSRTVTVEVDQDTNIKSNFSLSVGKNHSAVIEKKLSESVGTDHYSQVAKLYSLKAKKIQMEADDQIILKTGKASIVMKKNGDITIKGGKINVKGSGDIKIKGSKIAEN